VGWFVELLAKDSLLLRRAWHGRGSPRVLCLLYSLSLFHFSLLGRRLPVPLVEGVACGRVRRAVRGISVAFATWVYCTTFCTIVAVGL
jgi:hypothetical protein